MDQTMKVLRFDGEEPQAVVTTPSPQAELQHFRNVTDNVTEDALGVWAEIWAELGSPIGLDVAPDTEKGFKPSCGWPEFLEKMWLLRHYIDFLSRFSRL